MTMPRTGDPLVSVELNAKPKTASAKYSGGPNVKATVAKAGPTKASAKTATVPAMKDPIAEIASAGPARP